MKNDNVKSIEKLIDARQFLIEKAPFAQLYNFVIQNLINIDALAIWVYYQSKPDNWRPRKKEVEKHFMLSERKVHNAHMVLKECGLYEAIDQREKGKIIQWQVNIRCGIGCEELILAWKERYIQEKKIKKATKNQNVQKRHSGENTKTQAQQGVIQNGEKPQCDKTPAIQIKETSLNMKEKELLQTKGVGLVVDKSKKCLTIDSRLREAYRATPFVTLLIGNENDFIEAAIYSIKNREKNIAEAQRVQGIISLVKRGCFFDPHGWSKKDTEANDKLLLQEEHSKKMFEKTREEWSKRNKTSILKPSSIPRLGQLLKSHELS